MSDSPSHGAAAQAPSSGAASPCVPHSSVAEVPKAESPLWFPQAAASAFSARAFGGSTLPKASRLPKAGTAGTRGTGSLYDLSTLTSTVAAVRRCPCKHEQGDVLAVTTTQRAIMKP